MPEHPAGERDARKGERWLLLGGVLTGFASLLHIAIIVGGPDWYRFFGAGERMAKRAAHGSASPTIITAGIAVVLGVWALYALSGARLIRRLPFLRTILIFIATLYLARGVFGPPLIFLVEHPYTVELRQKLTFMVISSVICVVLAVCYAMGAIAVGRRL
jgi:putative oxidoreductase